MNESVKDIAARNKTLLNAVIQNSFKVVCRDIRQKISNDCRLFKTSDFIRNFKNRVARNAVICKQKIARRTFYKLVSVRKRYRGVQFYAF